MLTAQNRQAEQEYVREILNDALMMSTPDREKARDLVAQREKGGLGLVLLAIAQNNGSTEDVIRQVRSIRSEYLPKAATLYQEIGMAIEAMERTIASQIYGHRSYTDEEIESSPCYGQVDLTFDLGTDEDGNPVSLDFARTPHLAEIRETGVRLSLMEVIASQVRERGDVRCVVIGDRPNDAAKGEYSPLPCKTVVPPALDPFAWDACVDWLYEELEFRERLSEHDTDPGPLFVFADINENNDWMLGPDGLEPIAERGHWLNMHLIVQTSYSVRDFAKRDDTETIADLVDVSPHSFSLAILEGSRYGSLYRLVPPAEVDEWFGAVEKIYSSSERATRHSGMTPVINGVGTPFTTDGSDVRNVLNREVETQVLRTQRRGRPDMRAPHRRREP